MLTDSKDERDVAGLGVTGADAGAGNTRATGSATFAALARAWRGLNNKDSGGGKDMWGLGKAGR